MPLISIPTITGTDSLAQGNNVTILSFAVVPLSWEPHSIIFFPHYSTVLTNQSYGKQ